ncbi:kinase-like domain-containing protein [Exophiala viscosa]|uniref:kinase-like domain-containing protein n=1 Tax=Exophiala viscosa TaxID=2486360 RepID=UPI00219026A8|nr:kinase-like domain-containing protein [Exophiala viscosa]
MAGTVRQPLDVQALETYLAKHVHDIKRPIKLKKFGFGESNPTYLLTGSDDRRYVLRKRPPGALLSPTAHRVDREYRILRALEHTDVPAPKAYHYCADETVTGTAFYVMEFLDGRIYSHPSLPGLEPAERTAMWRSAVEALARLHLVDFTPIGLQTLGKSGGFYDRQIKTFTNLSASQAMAVDKATGIPIGAVPHLREMITFFADPSRQPQDRSTLIHGDYKIDNIVFHRTEPRVIGILDWEMATIGHPLSDFGNLTQPYWYFHMTGWDPSDEICWGDAFGAFRLAVVMQGIAARHALGQSGSAKAQAYGSQRDQTAFWAYSLVKDLMEHMEKDGRPTSQDQRLTVTQAKL